MKKGPCIDCEPPERYPGCHDRCEGYLEWKRELDEQREKIQKEQHYERITWTKTRTRRRR